MKRRPLSAGGYMNGWGGTWVGTVGRLLLSCGLMSVPPPADQLPGADLPAEVTKKLEARRLALGDGSHPRTRHLNDAGAPRFTNRLILESSPYLRQHAHNPVNWFPWGDEAFLEARRLGRPVLLSIGYSTCHWCHVMEEESFEDLEVAAYLNANYIAVKVDREERPDLDAIYMNAVQMLTGRGGWPMTTWLTPDRKVFYGGTYFPARDGDRGSRKGFLTLLRELNTVYLSQPDQVAARSRELAGKIRRNLETALPGGPVSPELLDQAVNFYRSRFDPRHGGLRGAPKFPSSLPVRFLLRRGVQAEDPAVREMALATLRSMARGGIYDHVGGGFHRYATDAAWQVPHFEKMLYDNALLVPAYVDAWQLTGDPEFARVVEEILGWLMREMTAQQGGFYSATDADSLNAAGEREEGAFFTWTPAEIREVLSDAQAAAFEAFYSIREDGNFEGRSIPYRSRPVAEVATQLGISPSQLEERLVEAKTRLYRARAKRPAPLRDDKILASWNGLAISALADAAFAFDRGDWLREGERAAEFLLGSMVIEGRLKRSHAEGRASINGYLDDHAFVVAGFLDLFRATSDLRWLERAQKLQGFQDANFWDAEAGGYFMTAVDHEKLLAREKPASDSAEPSGNSVAARNLIRLSAWTGTPHYRQKADKTVGFLGGRLQRSPSSLAHALLAIDFDRRPKQEVVLVDPPNSKLANSDFLTHLRQRFAPQTVIFRLVAGDDAEAAGDKIPWIAGKVAREGKTTAYVCRDRVCRRPTTSFDEFKQLLDGSNESNEDGGRVISPRKK